MTHKPARLVLLVDVPGWAYDNIANQIAPGLEADFEISRFHVKDHPDLATLMARILAIEPPAILHVFWRPLLFDLLDVAVLSRTERQLGLAPGEALRRLARLVLTTGVYDHLGLDPAGAARQVHVLSAVDAYSVSSPILDGIYRAIPDMPAPAGMLADGVDTDFYKPERSERLSETGRPFVIGWVGNSQWGFLEGLPDAKGLNTIIKPAMNRLEESSFRAELRLVDRAETWRPREEVARFYHELDCLLCASLVEGTPNPVLEAMASGVPIISTDVGIVRFCAGEKQREFIVERTPRAFAEAIRRLCATEGLRTAIGDENRRGILEHSWLRRREGWRDFMTESLARGMERGGEARHHALLNASRRLRPTLKMRVRSLLRRSPRLYAAASKLLHSLTRIIASVRMKRSEMLDRNVDSTRKERD